MEPIVFLHDNMLNMLQISRLLKRVRARLTELNTNVRAQHKYEPLSNFNIVVGLVWLDFLL